MPLFKGQGCKSTPGKVLQYITDENKAAYVTSLYLDDSRSYARQFRETAAIFGKGENFEERKYYHFKLSCDQADKVSASAHHEYAEALAAKLFPGYQCVIATHTDTNTVHSHIVVNAVSFETGKKLDIRNAEYGRMKDTANELGAERGFSTLDFRKPARERVTSQERIIELKGGTSWKEELREVIRLAKQDTRTMEEFEKYLNEYGVTLTRNTQKTIAFKHPMREKAIRGEKLGLDYTKGAIVNELDQNRRNDRWTGNRTADKTVKNREPATTRATSREIIRDTRAAISRATAAEENSRTERNNREAEQKRLDLERIREEAERSRREAERSRELEMGDWEPDF